MSPRRHRSRLLSLAALALAAPATLTALAAPTASAAPQQPTKPAKAAKPAKPKPATSQQWTIGRLELDGVVGIEEEDRGYSGTAHYIGLGRTMQPFQLTPARGAMPRIFTAVAPISYEGSSRASIRQLDASWDCSYTMAGLYVPKTLPIVFSITRTLVRMHLMVVPAGIKCPENAPAWDMYVVPERARTMDFELSRLKGVKVGATRLLPVDMRDSGTGGAATYDSRWNGQIVLRRVR